jgi:hypothetical protein
VANLEFNSLIGLYVNMCVQVLIYVRTKKTVVGARDRLLTFYDELPTSKDFYPIERCDFAELRNKLPRQQKRKEQPSTVLIEEYIEMGPPPAKQRNSGTHKE